nr:pyruvate formate lyase family protein [Spirochaetota bacterium]
MDEWKGFKKGKWIDKINVRNFIQVNYRPYDRDDYDDDTFLAESTEKTKKLWNKIQILLEEERKKGVYDAETKIPSNITVYKSAYIDKELEVIVGLQTNKPLKRSIMPAGGLRMVIDSLAAYGYKLDPSVEYIYKNLRKTHNDGVFQSYTDEMRRARKSGILTGLPDSYGRGRIIGDYRRVALYGADRLINDKKYHFELLDVS